MRSAVIVLALITGCATIGITTDEAQFAAGEAAFQIPTVIDELQTLTITGLCRETNPIIGPCGERVSVGVYFFTASVIHLAVSWILPPRARRWWQGLTAGGEIATTWKNHGDGITIWP